MKRLVIFASYDKNGIIHDYVRTYLSQLREVSDCIIFVADNECCETETKKISSLVDAMLCQWHGEYDFGSYKRGYQLAEKNGWLDEYDELILCNDSCFCIGSLIPMFEQMESEPYDFWGATGSTEIEKHLQSYFLVLKREVFSSETFRQYITSVEKKAGFFEVVTSYEVPLMGILETNGYRGGAFFFDFGKENPTFKPLHLLGVGIPLVKRKVFSTVNYSSESVALLLKNLNERNPESVRDIFSYFGKSFLLSIVLKDFKKMMFRNLKNKRQRGKTVFFDYLKQPGIVPKLLNKIVRPYKKYREYRKDMKHYYKEMSVSKQGGLIPPFPSYRRWRKEKKRKDRIVKSNELGFGRQFYFNFSEIFSDTILSRHCQFFLGSLLKQQEGCKKTVLLVSHELTLTGAPVALFDFAKVLRGLGYFPVILSLNDGQLREDCVKENIPVIVIEAGLSSDFVYKTRTLYKFVVTNTIVTASVVSKLSGTTTKVIWWVHEASLAYIDEHLLNMPENLDDNIKVVTAGWYAKEQLMKRRPNYQVGELLYMVEDISLSNEKSKFNACWKEKTVIACIGSIEERKGQDIFVEAIRNLSPNEIAKAVFVFIGRNHNSEIYDQIIKLKKDYPDSVVYFESMPRNELCAAYKDFDYLVCCSRDDPMPIVVTEALCFGKRVICSDGVGSAALLQRYGSGIVFPNESKDHLTLVLSKILSLPVEKGYVDTKARLIYDENFTETVFIKRYHEIEKSLLTDKDKNVSVIIPTFNAGMGFAELLKSLKEQKGLNSLEITVVDSGSTDETISLCVTEKVNLVQITKEEFSHCYSRNLGAWSSSGNVLLFMTQDALPSDENWVWNMVSPIYEEGVVAVSCMEECPEKTDLFYRLNVESHKEFIGKKDLLCNLNLCTDALQFRRCAALNDVSCAVDKGIFLRFLYRLSYAEDLDLGVRLLLSGYQLKLLRSVSVIHGHNRSVLYYLKRGLCDATYVPKILGFNSDKNLKSSELFNLVYAYACLIEIRKRMQIHSDKPTYVYLEEIQKTIKYISNIKLEEARKIILECEEQDSIAQILKMIAVKCPLQGNVRYERTLMEVIDYFNRNCIVFIEREYQQITAEIHEQIIESLMKKFAICMAFHLERLEAEDSLSSLVSTLKNGV